MNCVVWVLWFEDIKLKWQFAMDWALNYLLFSVKSQLSHKDFEGLRVKNLKTECSCGFYDLF